MPPPAPPAVEEPLALSAPLAWREAPGLCARVVGPGGDCAWYHRLWQYLRLLDLVTAPPAQGEFYLAEIGRRLAARERPRVLIAGSADYAMPAWVLAACRRAGLGARLTVVDRCATPLRLSRWYAARSGARILTRQADLAAFSTRARFDLLCTHSFLGYFAPAARRELLARWHGLLAPGAAVLTVHRLRPGSREDARIGFTPAQAEAFCRRVREAALRHGAGLGIAPALLERAAAEYTRRLRIYPIASREALQALFAGAGFEVVRLETGTVPGRGREPAAGPTAPGHAEYARLVALRA